MFCPKCQTKASTGQRFCRSCGKRLQGIPQAVGRRDDQLGNTDSQETKLERWANKIGQVGTIALATLIVSIIALSLIGNIFGLKVEGFGFELI